MEIGGVGVYRGRSRSVQGGEAWGGSGRRGGWGWLGMAGRQRAERAVARDGGTAESREQRVARDGGTAESEVENSRAESREQRSRAESREGGREQRAEIESREQRRRSRAESREGGRELELLACFVLENGLRKFFP
uniref:Uncharacterized protein n=1 Tax=Fagus sylvatica TaxID=28930 RepID=A0A2N9HV61_FAGSY